MRSRAIELGLAWADAWDRPRLNAALARARALKRMRLAQLEREGTRIGVQAGDRPRKADWVKSILRAEFPSPPEPTQPEHPVRGAWLLRLSGLLGMGLVVLVMVLVPLASWRLAQISQGAVKGAGSWAADTADTLRQSARGLRSASDALESSNLALRSVGASLDDTKPLLTSVGDVLGRQTPVAIEAARQSLVDAQSGAQAVDRVLRGLSILGIGYNPDQPLAEGLAETADSLEPLPAALSEASQHLRTTQTDLDQVSRDVVEVSDDLANMATQISPVADDLDHQADDLSGLGDDLVRLSDSLPGWIWGGTAALELVLLIAAVSQYSVWVVGRRWDS
jgi:hypothetical protein